MGHTTDKYVIHQKPPVKDLLTISESLTLSLSVEMNFDLKKEALASELARASFTKSRRS